MPKLKNSLKLRKEIFEKVIDYYRLFLDKESLAVPASGKKYDEKELISIVSAALDGWWTDGEITAQFEKKFCKFLGVKHTMVVNSGSSANLLALKSLASAKLGKRRLNPGDEVITTAVAFPTTINPIIQCGCIPVFCDIDLPTYTINVGQLEKAISKKTKAVFFAHTMGSPFNAKKIADICKKHDLWFIEDNCDSLGAKYKDKFCGTFGDISTCSFYPAHHITMGEGGALCTNNDQLAKIIKSMRDWGRDCWCKTGKDNSCKRRFQWKLGDLPYGYDHKYIYSEIGYNLKNTDLNVAIGLAQIDKIGGFIKARKNNFFWLKEKFSKFAKYFILPESLGGADPSWFGFLITIRENSPFSRLDLLKYLNENKVGTRLLFGGNITKQPYFIENKIKHRVVENIKNTDFIMNNSFWIGLHPRLKEKHLVYMYRTFEKFLKDFN